MADPGQADFFKCLTSTMQKFIFFLPAVWISSFIFSQNITRLDGTTITAINLDQKINQLMTDASVTGMAMVFSITLFFFPEKKWES